MRKNSRFSQRRKPGRRNYSRRTQSLSGLFQLIRRKPWIALLALVAGGGWYVNERQVREAYSYQGLPKSVAWSQELTTRVFRNDGFMLGYSETRKNPLWVVYQLTAMDKRQSLKRPQRFSIDNRTLSRVAHDDYTGSGYDRGHMAPNYAISTQYGRAAQKETFLMTNITPQKPKLNQKFWQRLEAAGVDHFTQQFDNIWVYTGPIFDEQREYLKSGVEIADAFYKIYLAPPTAERKQAVALTFIVPQTVNGKEPLDQFLATIDEVEQRTGINFFHALPDVEENVLEATQSTQPWRLNQVARRPGRY